METTIEQMLSDFEKNNALISNLLKEQQKIAVELRKRPQAEWDWVSVPVASRKLDVSACMIYQRINRGKLNCRRIENKIYVNLNDLMEIDDSKASV